MYVSDFKKFLAVTACLGSLALGSITIGATEIERNGLPTGNSIEISGEGVNASTDALEITTSSEKGVVHIQIKNTSNEDVKNLSVVYDDSNSSAAYKNLYKIGTLAAGKSTNYDLATIATGQGLFRDVIDGVGGFHYLILLIPVFVVGIGLTSSLIIVRVKLKKFKHNILLGCVGVVLTVAATGGMYVGLHYTTGIEEYTMLDTGENYTRLFDVDMPDGDLTKFSIKYNQDIITYTVTESDEEIPFDTVYEYDETKECTADSTIKSAGKLGKKHVVTTTVYRNGRKDDESSKETVILNSTDQVEIQGTKTVIETQNVEAYKEYIPDNTMYVGQFKLQTSTEEAKSHIGKKEVTWNWDKNQNKLVSKEEITQQPGTDTWKAGSLVEVDETLKSTIDYVPVEDQAIGYTNTVTEGQDGKRVTLYNAIIDPTTGLRKTGTELEFVSSETTDPVNGKVEVGILKVEDVTTPRTEEVQYDDSQWTYQETVLEEGADKVERVTSIMKLDKETGQVTDQVDREVSRETLQINIPRKVIRGSKEPTWVEEKVITGEVEYNTVYVPDDSLSGDEQKVVQKGEKGSLYTTQLIAVDEEGNPIKGYSPQIVEEDALSESKDEIIHVAPDSPLLD